MKIVKKMLDKTTPQPDIAKVVDDSYIAKATEYVFESVECVGDPLVELVKAVQGMDTRLTLIETKITKFMDDQILINKNIEERLKIVESKIVIIEEVKI